MSAPGSPLGRTMASSERSPRLTSSERSFSLPTTCSSLTDFVYSVPAVDNHAHNLFADSCPEHFSTGHLVSEAAGRALGHATATLAHARAVKMLAKWMQCDANDEAIAAKRKQLEYTDWCKKCFDIARLEVVLMDTGFAVKAPVLPLYEHHATTFEIFRLEHDVEEVLRDVLLVPNHHHHLQMSDVNAFHQGVAKKGEKWQSSQCVALKTVICYRTGLDIHPDERYQAEVWWLDEVKKTGCRIQHKAFHDFLITRLCAIVGKLKPIQLHTGVGDCDLDIQLANPSLLKKLVVHFPSVRFVLLHTGWPFLREAAYMASMYANVYLDLSLVAPILSSTGIKRALEEILELAPISKLLFGTDGHNWPETFALSSVQFRIALAEIFESYVQKGELTDHEAMLAIRNIMYDNANRLYALGLRTPALPKITRDKTAMASPSVLVSPSSPMSPNYLPSMSSVNLSSQYLAQPIVTSPKPEDTSSMTGGPRWIRIMWVDTAGLHRCRIVPSAKFSPTRGILLAKAALWLGTRDSSPAVAPVADEFAYIPDIQTMRALPYLNGTSSVHGWFRDKDQTKRKRTELTCPRALLKKVESEALEAFDTSFLVGFEMEFTLLESTDPIRFVKGGPWSATSKVRAGSKALIALEEIVACLQTMGIDVPLFHAESAPGQVEIPLGPLPPLAAADQFVAAREAVHNIAAKNGLHATLAPRLAATGSGVHIHVSLDRSSADPRPPGPSTGKHDPPAGMTSREKHFLAGLLTNLPAVIAFTMPSASSYARMKDGIWSGGTFAAWGIENREAPVRLCWNQHGDLESRQYHFEMKLNDGTSNPYTAVAAVLIGGLLGLENEPLLPPPIQRAAATLTPDERAASPCITAHLPRDLPDALLALKKNKSFVEAIGPEVCDLHCQVRQHEYEIWQSLETEERVKLVVENY